MIGAVRHVAYTLALVVLGFGGFGAIYGFTNVLTEFRDFRVPVHLDLERRIPFVPAMTVVYASLYPMFLLTPFLLKTRAEVHALLKTFWIEVAVGAVFFVVIPADVAYPPNPDAGLFTPVFDVVTSLSMNHNLFPSMHVTFAVTFMTAFARVRLPWLFGAWGVAICASTVLTHQHHLVDVAGGVVLAFICLRRFYLREVPARAVATA